MSDDPERPLDRADRLILDALQHDGRLTMAELAERVSLSASPCWRRVQMLERAGVIRSYHAHLDRHLVGLGVHGFVWLRMENHLPRTTQSFEQQVQDLPQVIACHNLSGHFDYQLEIVAADHEAFSRLVREKVRLLHGVRDVITSFTLKEVKSEGLLPLGV